MHLNFFDAHRFVIGKQKNAGPKLLKGAFKAYGSVRSTSGSSKRHSGSRSSSSHLATTDASEFGFPLGKTEAEAEHLDGLDGVSNELLAGDDGGSFNNEALPPSGTNLVTAGITMDGVGSTEHSRPFSIRGIRPVTGFQDESVPGGDSLFLSGGDVLPPDLNQVSAWASDVDTAREQSYIANSASPNGGGRNEPYYSSASIADLLAEINNSAL